MAASREYHPEWDNPVTKEQTKYAVTDSGMLTPRGSHCPRNNSQTVWSPRKKESKKIQQQKNYAQSVHTKKILTNSVLYPVLHVLFAHCN